MFSSKAQIAKYRELVKLGQMRQEYFDKKMKAAKNPHLLPERIGESKHLVDPKRVGGRYK